MAIYNSVHLDLKFPKVVYKKLLDVDIYLEDIEEFEPENYATLRNILSMEESIIESMELNFSIDYDYFGAVRTHELKPNGTNILVTKKNRKEFVKLYVDWICNVSIEKQFTPFYRGFYKVISKQSIEVKKKI